MTAAASAGIHRAPCDAVAALRELLALTQRRPLDNHVRPRRLKFAGRYLSAMDVLSIGAAGLSAAGQRFAASAERTASGAGAPVSEAVEQVSAKAAFDASLAVVKAGDDLLKRLLDIKV